MTSEITAGMTSDTTGGRTGDVQGAAPFMSATLAPEEMEGRLHAHRELLVDMLAAMIGGETTIVAFVQKLRDSATFKDNEEDPGMEPGEAFAIENAAAREVRAILEAARARAEAELR